MASVSGSPTLCTEKMSVDEVLECLREISPRVLPNSEQEIEIQAYEEWAISEIYYRLSDSPNSSPEDVLFWFKAEMYSYSDIFSDREINPFFVAVSVANHVLAMFEYPRED